MPYWKRKALAAERQSAEIAALTSKCNQLQAHIESLEFSVSNTIRLHSG